MYCVFQNDAGCLRGAAAASCCSDPVPQVIQSLVGLPEQPLPGQRLPEKRSQRASIMLIANTIIHRIAPLLVSKTLVQV